VRDIQERSVEGDIWKEDPGSLHPYTKDEQLKGISCRIL
jgi:hypothetical protein